MSPAVVKPRQSRYNVVPDASGSGASKVRVLSAISTWDELSPERRAEMNAIYNDQSFVRDKAGAGGFWQRDSAGKVAKVSVIAKLLMLGLTKFATMDPFGMGVEMEGGKPGWNDAMNGLPGLLGSGMPETYEMLVIINYVKSALDKFGKSIVFPSEFVELMYAVDDALIKYSRSQKGEEDMFLYWEKTNLARENYRKSTEIVFSGNMTAIPSIDLSKLLRRVQTKVEEGIERSLKITDNVSPTYFFYECTDFNSTSTAGKGIVHAKKFEVRQLPLFLEGPTRHLKILTDQEHRREVYWRTKNSDLYDSKLQMFAISASLSEMGQEVGRMKAFNPGWLENQSIWLHMSYKFYLELLRAGLYDEFFDEIKTGLVPFMDDEIYGRSPLEASSFIVSSVFPDPKLHGTGFLPRLSGSTAELLSMWAIMMAGPKPFQLDKNGDLTLNLTPILPGWMFHIDKTVSFTFLGSINVTYYNPNLYDTWTVQSKKISYTNIDGTKMEIEGSTFDRDTAKSVRELQVSAIFLEF